MNIVNQLTLRYMKQNKSRTLVTIIGVIISVAMLTAVFSISSSFMDMMQRNTIAYTGKWQAAFLDVAGEDVAVITNTEAIERYDIDQDLGFARLSNSANRAKPYLYITGHSNHDVIGISPIDGRLPKNENELALSSQFLQTAGVSWKVGDVVTLDFGKRSLNKDGTSETLGNNDAYQSKEVFTPTKTKTYTITGIVQAPAREQDAMAAYRAFSGLSEGALEEGFPYTVRVEYKDFKGLGNDIYETSDTIASKVSGVKNQGKSNGVKIKYNRDLLLYSGISSDSRFLNTMYLAVLTVGSIILIGSFSLIYNAFSISLSERSRTLGMLSSVGATKQQKRASVFFEAAVIGVIAIPAGLFFGSIGIGVTLHLLSPFIQKMFVVSEPMRLVIEPYSMIAVILFSILTLLISAWFPAVRASRITPITAIRQTKDIEIKGKDVRTSKMTRKLFGYEAELGLKNLKRNKHHYRSTVFSLAISVILYLAASSFSLYMDKSYNMAQAPLPYDLSVYARGADWERVRSLTNDLMSVQNATTKVKTQFIETDLFLNENEVTTDISSRKTLNPDGKYFMSAKIVSLDEASFAAYLQSAGIDAKKLEGDEISAILVNQITLKEKHNFTDITQLTVQEGSEIPLPLIEGAKVRIASITDKRPPFMLRYEEDVYRVTFVVSERDFDKLRELGNDMLTEQIISEVQFTTEQSAALENEINPIINRYPDVHVYTTNLIAERQDALNRATVTSVFLYGFVVLIGLICMANIINTISTGMALRKREFAMLASIGMTPEGMKKMLRFEGFFYGMKSLIYGLPISLCVMFFIYMSLSRNFEFAFTLPWANLIIAGIGVFFIVGTSILYATRKYKEQSIVESLKNENI
ncbi:ABC transporter permease [Brevibacillus porteri]|uniref:ABC transporter permease n=1 Tax=Brevibacillus porteri TaxID=2126350 RepID=A0ABX5FS67_9BACL|nr:ABC transporter permease [Brevibacillus porteri]MED1797186.1 FtsX-like permease family protein [Brevibacillus porteri]MED2133324.1 FtsX-like permease family protein [Brevibacillus porteri]MED2746417.1 FtsX-like permease family protein [Brevibacillus porteri]MED2815074.1 FtsX-like permease family protein [Brevibacillus porteri]MED2892671.1 FtsX-like permease family protein [Brevibacillus porteri]